MPRAARIVVPTIPHHVIQRGNRRMDVFFEDSDYRMYLSLLKAQCAKAGTKITAYCLMPNHVHLVLVPGDVNGLRIVGEAHRLYTRYVNRKMGWQGYLWQGRFGSYPMDERYAYEAVRYVELNPVRAGLCHSAPDYRWSSARQRVGHHDSMHDLKVAAASFFSIEDWHAYWAEGLQKDDLCKAFEENEVSLNPLGILSSGTQ